ncbi:trigger factor [Sciscionella sediminilitoris]|uniref:trigger factor n=1 Tax=Sciscionella sediminilitoris TaxID=1445613 RepID=UPI0004DF27CE|nr:trigger factor [Sciscionella sp. SE31]
MKSTVEQLSPTRVRINVEVPFDELKPSFDSVYRKLAQQVNIPGFRPGKAPARLLEGRIGRAAVLSEVVNDVVPTKYLEAVQNDEVATIGRPDIEVTKVEDGEPVEFTAEVDVRPELTLPAYGEIAVTVDPAPVTEEQVDSELDQLRARFGTLSTVERAIENGDFVSIDLSATVDGTKVDEATTTGLSYEVGSGELIEGIDEALIGTESGGTTHFTTKLVAGEFVGKDADVEVTVQSVKERELPEADDEFASMASEFDTIDELRESLRERVGRMNTMQQAVDARDKVLEALLDTVEVPLPQAVVDAEVEQRQHDAVHPFDHDEDQFNAYLETQGQTREEFDAEAKAEAEKAVKQQLILDAIAEQEQVSVEQNELTERIIYQAQRFGISPDEYVKRAQESGQFGAIFADVRRGKALSNVVRQATVTDTEGAKIDLEELFGEAKDAAEAETAEVEKAEEPEEKAEGQE